MEETIMSIVTLALYVWALFLYIKIKSNIGG